MNCQETQYLLHAYGDGELDLVKSLDIEGHLRGCPRCTREHQNARSVGALMADDSLYFRAPENVRHRVTAALRQSIKPEPRPRARLWSWPMIALSATAVVVLSLSLAPYFSGSSGEARLTQELASGHVRSLMATHLTDVASTDQHTVKPWFEGKLDFSPPVKDLAGQGFPLVGGRMDYLNGRQVAALVYTRHKHVINLFVWPSADSTVAPSPVAGANGYHFIRWTGGGMSLWAVSDLNEAEMMEFARDFAGN